MKKILYVVPTMGWRWRWRCSGTVWHFVEASKQCHTRFAYERIYYSDVINMEAKMEKMIYPKEKAMTHIYAAMVFTIGHCFHLNNGYLYRTPEYFANLNRQFPRLPAALCIITR